MTAFIRPFIASSDYPYMQHHAHNVLCADTVGVTCCDPINGEIFGCIVFDTFAPNSAQCHLALTRPLRCLRARLLHHAAELVFIRNNRGVCFAPVVSSNTRSLQFCRHAGWREVATLVDGFDIGVDVILMRMDRRDCPWLVPKNDPVQLDLFDEAV